MEYIEVSDCKMQEGSLRADVNVSVRKKGETKLGTRTEMKNMNSFRSIVRAIEYEVDRQIDVIENGGKIDQETLRWDDVSGKTFPMRDKEDAQDYRYFPDPDLLKRLNRIEGQVRGVKKMLEEDRYCVDILTQVSAINSALNSFNKVLLAEHIKSCVVDDIRAGKEEAVDELCATLQKLMK